MLVPQCTIITSKRIKDIGQRFYGKDQISHGFELCLGLFIKCREGGMLKKRYVTMYPPSRFQILEYLGVCRVFIKFICTGKHVKSSWRSFTRSYIVTFSSFCFVSFICVGTDHLGILKGTLAELNQRLQNKFAFLVLKCLINSEEKFTFSTYSSQSKVVVFLFLNIMCFTNVALVSCFMVSSIRQKLINKKNTVLKSTFYICLLKHIHKSENYQHFKIDCGLEVQLPLVSFLCEFYCSQQHSQYTFWGSDQSDVVIADPPPAARTPQSSRQRKNNLHRSINSC